MRVAYVDGRFSPIGEAGVSVEDRGFQFADGVYEVWAVLDGRLADWEGHHARLNRSLSELKISGMMGEGALLSVLRETVRRNRVENGLLYLQVTRGAARRDHPFPDPAVAPTVVATCRPILLSDWERRGRDGVAVITQPDIRWGRCDIKSVALLPNILAKQAAKAAGAAEAWLVDDAGLVTEGGATNAWIIDADGALRTRSTQSNILSGITRAGLMRILEDEGIAVEERPFTVEEARAAREAFFTAASAFVSPVVKIDGAVVGDGSPGPVSRHLRALYLEEARRTAI